MREAKMGSQLSARTVYQVNTGDFVYSRLFAWRGAFGVIPKELHGCFVSNEFPAFVPRDNRIDVRFLYNWFRLRPVLRAVESDCTCSTPLTRNRFKEEFFLRLHIPLPSLAEQRRIVGRIERLAGRVAEVQRLRKSVIALLDQLARSTMRSDGSGVPTPMRNVVRMREPDVDVQPDQEYTFAGVYSFGRGVFRGEVRSGMEFSYPRLTRLREGDFVYPKLMAWEGAFGVVPAECDGCVVSTEFPVFEIDHSRVLPEVVDTYFRSPSVWPEISGASPGTNVRRRRLKPEAFLGYQMPIPSRRTQERVRAVHRLAQSVKPLRRTSDAKLEALVPSILDKAFSGEL